MKKNKAGNGQILVGQAKIDHEERVKREIEDRAARAAAKHAARERRRLERELPKNPPGPPPLRL